MEYLNGGSDAANLTTIGPRKGGLYSDTTAVLEFNQVAFLRSKVIPLFLRPNVLRSRKKYKDFLNWATLVNIYFFGYHILPEGLSLIKSIKRQSSLNAEQLST
jgi:hypothetical protein